MRYFTVLLGLALICCAGPGSREAGTGEDESARPRALAPGPKPDWVDRGGRSPRFPDVGYVTGFGVAEGQGALDAAKERAAADLATRIEVRIEHELRDVSAERDGRYSYEVAAVTRSTVDIQLGGLTFEAWQKGDTAYALAIVQRASAARQRRDRRRLAIVEMRECLSRAEALEQAGRKTRAVAAYEDCRRPIAEALQHEAVARALLPDPGDAAVHRELVAATRTIDEKVDEVLDDASASLSAAAESLALQLARQGVSTASRLDVQPFTYGTADLSSTFGREAASELESALARLARRQMDEQAEALIVRGVYLERDGGVRLQVTAKRQRTAHLVAGAGTFLPSAAIPANLDLRPANFEQALQAQRALSDGGLITGDLRLELWTNKGRRGVVLTESEEFKIYLRVNRPSYVRLIYVLQNGAQVPIDQSFRIDPSKVNSVVEYPYAFEVVPPFGVEHIHATAFTERPPLLATRRTVIGGVPYEVVVDGIEQIVRTRGLRIKNDEQVAEAFVAVTTTPRGRSGS